MIDVELNSQEDYEKSVEKLKSVLEEYLTSDHRGTDRDYGQSVN